MTQCDGAEIAAWVTLDDGREVLVCSPVTEDTPLPIGLALGQRVALSRHHRWWGGPTDWEFQEGPGFLRRLW